MRAMRLACLSLGAATFWATGPVVAGSALVPHRAVYDLSLDRASDRSGITGINGRMVYEFTGSRCDGYTVKFRFVTRIDSAETTRLTDQQTTTYEDAEGEVFNFVTRSFVDQALEKEVKGSARREPGGTAVALEKPNETAIVLSPTQFPTQHLKELIDKAATGENFYETTLFDGSDDADEVMTTTVVIGRAEEPANGDPEFEALPHREAFWPVSIAYFNASGTGGEEVPVYSISFKLHESGVTRGLRMDYGEFAMLGQLVDLSMYPSQDDDCP